MSGKSGDDAKRYQEKGVAEEIQKVKRNQP
jgi:hypothetical protein